MSHLSYDSPSHDWIHESMTHYNEAPSCGHPRIGIDNMCITAILYIQAAVIYIIILYDVMCMSHNLIDSQCIHYRISDHVIWNNRWLTENRSVWLISWKKFGRWGDVTVTWEYLMIELLVVPHHTTAGDMNKFVLRRWTVLKSDWFVLLMKQKVTKKPGIHHPVVNTPDYDWP